MDEVHGPPDAITVSSWYDGTGNFGKISDYFAFSEEYLLATPERKAAPDLLAACEQYVERWDSGCAPAEDYQTSTEPRYVKVARDAIRKAAGDTD